MVCLSLRERSLFHLFIYALDSTIVCANVKIAMTVKMGGEPMCIQVVLKSGNKEVVSREDLQFLMLNQQVLFFKRSDGWVVVGRDKMREHESPTVANERRKHEFFAIDY